MHRFDELLKVHRLAHVTVGAQPVTVHDVCCSLEEVRITTGSSFVRSVRAQPAQHLEAVEPGQLQVEQNHRRL